jgi:hypothetical protein
LLFSADKVYFCPVCRIFGAENWDKFQSLIWMPPCVQVIFDIWHVEVGLLSYIRPLMQDNKPAGPDGIRRKSPYLRHVLEGQVTARLSFPWSDLFCHQSFISLRNAFC